MTQPRYITSLDQVEQLSPQEREQLREVSEKFAFRTNDYYLKLIDWNNPLDPLRKLVIPSNTELEAYGQWDASDEATNYVVPGCQHKYATTALLVVSEVCGSYCRYCFRKRLFRNEEREATTNIQPGLQYIEAHPEINNVLLTGGDPLMLSTKKLRSIIQALRQIPHVQIIRIGTKLLAFNPMRIYEDTELLQLISQFSTPEKRIYIMAHLTHPREITPQTLKAVDDLYQAGAIIVNQTPILKGINDDPILLGELLDKLSWTGITPYYFFVNRPVAGNHDFVLPLQRIYEVVEKAKARTSGLGKRVKLVMSHASGKIELLAISNGKAYLKYHQSKAGDYGRVMILDCPEDAAWFDDLPGSETYWQAKTPMQ